MGLELVRHAEHEEPLIISPEEALRAEAARQKDKTASEPMAEIMFRVKTGFIDSFVLRNPDEAFEYACFEQRDGNWLLTALGLK